MEFSNHESECQVIDSRQIHVGLNYKLKTFPSNMKDKFHISINSYSNTYYPLCLCVNRSESPKCSMHEYIRQRSLTFPAEHSLNDATPSDAVEIHSPLSIV